MREERSFNPLDKWNLGESVEKALLERPAQALGKIEPFGGAGIYAIYYKGDFAPYREIAARNKSTNPNQPIYVGKAIPSGGRKGSLEKYEIAGEVLYKRLREHAESIEQVKNLDVVDFTCRYLVVDDIWIPLGETLLITKFSPLWNVVVDGFGNHDPGKGRYKGRRPSWDALHPGRPWALKCEPSAKTGKEILKDIESFLQKGKK